jgi:hypothetical protein
MKKGPSGAGLILQPKRFSTGGACPLRRGGTAICDFLRPTKRRTRERSKRPIGIALQAHPLTVCAHAHPRGPRNHKDAAGPFVAPCGGEVILDSVTQYATSLGSVPAIASQIGCTPVRPPPTFQRVLIRRYTTPRRMFSPAVPGINDLRTCLTNEGGITYEDSKHSD